MGDGKLVLKGSFDGGADGLLGSLGGIGTIVEQADEGEAGVGRVEEGAVGVVGAPIVGIALPGLEPVEQPVGVGLGGIAVGVAAGGFVEFCSCGEGTIIVNDIGFAVVGHGGVVGLEELEGSFGGLQVTGIREGIGRDFGFGEPGVRKVPGNASHRGHGEGGNGHSPARPETGLIAAPVVSCAVAAEGCVFCGLNAIGLLLGGNDAVFGQLTGTRSSDRAIERSAFCLDADEVVGAIRGFVEDAAHELAVVGAGAMGEQFVGFQKAIDDKGDLLGIEVG